MCQITEIILSGENFGTEGTPTALAVTARISGCDRFDIRVFNATDDTAPLLSVDAVSATTGADLVSHTFTLPPDSGIACGDTLLVQVTCATDPSCSLTQPVLVQCKGFEGNECPTTGPALAVSPPVDMQADCIAAGTYTVTIGGTWPTGTAFSWSTGAIPPGTLNQTGVTTQSFTLNHAAGSGSRIVMAEVQPPGCPDVESVVVFPPADDANCPTSVTLQIDGPGGFSQTVTAGPGPGTWTPALTDLEAGDYSVTVTAPTGAEIEYTWLRDNIAQALGVTTLADQTMDAATTSTISVIVQAPCCNPLLVNLALSTQADAQQPPADLPPEEPAPEDPPPVDLPPPPPWCPVLDIVVAFALIIAMAAITSAACVAILPGLFATLVVAMIAAIVVAGALLLICGPDPCRILGVISWAMSWSVMVCGAIAILCLSIIAWFLVVIMGGITAVIIWWLISNGCSVPRLNAFP